VAGFQVTTSGRFWVTPEGFCDYLESIGSREIVTNLLKVNIVTLTHVNTRLGSAIFRRLFAPYDSYKYGEYDS